MALEAKRREVLEYAPKELEVLGLLYDYRTYWTPYGSARPLEESHVVDVAYGPAGYVEAGREFDERDRKGLEKSYEYLEHALTMLRTSGKEEELLAYTLLRKPYTGDPGDPGVVDVWRALLLEWEKKRKRVRKKTPGKLAAWQRENPKPRSIEWHDLGIRRLAHYLRFVDLHVVSAKPMSEEEEEKSRVRDAELHASYQRLRVSGLKLTAAAEHAASLHGVSVDAMEKIIEFGSALPKATCEEPGCERGRERGNLCFKHYQQARRREKKEERV